MNVRLAISVELQPESGVRQEASTEALVQMGPEALKRRNPCSWKKPLVATQWVQPPPSKVGDRWNRVLRSTGRPVL